MEYQLDLAVGAVLAVLLGLGGALVLAQLTPPNTPYPPVPPYN